MLTETSNYLGPATVIEVAQPCLRVIVDRREVDATLALPYGYVASRGDRVLVIGQDDDFYVIGILQGSGKITFDAGGDLEFRVVNGTLRLFSTSDVAIQAPRVKVQGGSVEIVAQRLIERLGDAYRWVRGCSQLRAERTRTVVEDEYSITAKRISAIAEGDVRIDGDQINLG